MVVHFTAISILFHVSPFHQSGGMGQQVQHLLEILDGSPHDEHLSYGPRSVKLYSNQYRKSGNFGVG